MHLLWRVVPKSRVLRTCVSGALLLFLSKERNGFERTTLLTRVTPCPACGTCMVVDLPSALAMAWETVAHLFFVQCHCHFGHVCSSLMYLKTKEALRDEGLLCVRNCRFYTQTRPPSLIRRVTRRMVRFVYCVFISFRVSESCHIRQFKMLKTYLANPRAEGAGRLS